MIFVFDLDDTLYGELTYVRSGFSAVARHLAAVSECQLDPNTLIDDMESNLQSDGRGAVFNFVLEKYGLCGRCSVVECVGIYRSHMPCLKLFPGVAETLKELRPHGCYVVTDGCPVVQQSKAIALRLHGTVRGVVLTSVFGAAYEKPALGCFEMIAARESVGLNSICYVGDNPKKDFVHLRSAGAATVRVLTGHYADELAAPGYDAEITIPTIGFFLENIVRSGSLTRWGFDG